MIETVEIPVIRGHNFQIEDSDDSEEELERSITPVTDVDDSELISGDLTEQLTDVNQLPTLQITLERSENIWRLPVTENSNANASELTSTTTTA